MRKPPYTKLLLNVLEKSFMLEKWLTDNQEEIQMSSGQAEAEFVARLTAWSIALDEAHAALKPLIKD